jgi:protein-S-isoprenylcysteine O-methyltransferase Ste14
MLPVFATNRTDLYLFLIVTAIWWVPELISGITRKRPQNAQRQNRASGVILIASIYVAITLGLQISYSAKQFAIPWYRTILFGTGLFLILAGVALRWYAIWYLGKFFTTTIVIQPGQTVVETGPYRYIRHPSYSGALLIFTGIGLCLTNWLSLGLVVLGAFLAYTYRVQVEEQVLVDGLGQPYRDYMKRTKRFIPFVI